MFANSQNSSPPLALKICVLPLGDVVLLVKFLWPEYEVSFNLKGKEKVYQFTEE